MYAACKANAVIVLSDCQMLISMSFVLHARQMQALFCLTADAHWYVMHAARKAKEEIVLSACQRGTGMWCCWPCTFWKKPLVPSRSITCPFCWLRMRAKTATLFMTVSTMAESACLSMCSKAGPVTQHCADPCCHQRKKIYNRENAHC